MFINDIIRRWQPLFEQENGAGGGGDPAPKGDAGDDADNGGKGGDDNSANSPDAVLNANAGADKGTDDTADAKSASDDPDKGDTSGKDDDKSGEDKSDDESDTVPEGDYQFELPEGMELDEAMAETMTPIFKELGITQGQANQLVAAYGEQIRDQAEAQAQDFVNRVQTWTDTAKSDPEIGNDKWEATVAMGNNMLQKFGTPELTEVLIETGLSNHPEVIRFMARTGNAFGDDEFNPGETVDTGDVPTETSWYGATTPTTKKG